MAENEICMCFNSLCKFTVKEVKHPKTSAELEALDEYFLKHSYASGHELTDEDSNLFASFEKAPDVKYKHLCRWYNHIKAIGGAKVTQKTSDEPAEAVVKSNAPKERAAKTSAKALQDAAKANGPQKGAKAAVAAAAVAKKDDDDDDVDLFGSDDDDPEKDAEAERIKEARLKAYAEKKSKKPALIAKSSVILDCKPWDDETDMKAMEEQVRSIEMDGLLWGASKLVPVGFGIKKLQIMCVIEDEKVSVDLLQEKIEAFEDYVQSVDIAAFNKI